MPSFVLVAYVYMTQVSLNDLWLRVVLFSVLRKQLVNLIYIYVYLDHLLGLLCKVQFWVSYSLCVKMGRWVEEAFHLRAKVCKITFLWL